MDSRRRAILAAGLGIYASSVLPQPTVKLPKIGLGTWQTFDAGNDSAARAPLREVLKLLDGNVVDSSPMYGSSEAVAGALFRQTKGKALPPWAAELGIASWAQYFLKWIVSHPAVTCAIPGTGRPEHMRDNLAAGRGPFPDAAARERMAEYFDSL